MLQVPIEIMGQPKIWSHLSLYANVLNKRTNKRKNLYRTKNLPGKG